MTPEQHDLDRDDRHPKDGVYIDGIYTPVLGVDKESKTVTISHPGNISVMFLYAYLESETEKPEPSE